MFDLGFAKIGVYICYDRHFPEGARALGLNGAEIVFNPSATVAGLSEYLWKLEQPAHAVANGYFVGAINRVGVEAPWNIGEFYGQSYFCDPRGQIVEAGLARQRRSLDGRPGSRHDRRGPQNVAVLPRPPAGHVRIARESVIPMTKDEIILANQEFLFPSVFHYYKEPLVVTRAKDQYVWDADGNQYLDFFGGIVTVSVGHCNDQVNAKVHQQLDTLQHVSTVFANEPQAALAKKIASITPGGELTNRSSRTPAPRPTRRPS